MKSLLSLFLQDNCPLCDRSTPDPICTYCVSQLKTCQLPNPCQFWRQELPLFVWGHYDGKLKRAIATLKYNHHRELGERLGIYLGESWQKFPPLAQLKGLTVVPIPLHPKKLKARGFNQCDLIAQGFCRLTGYPLLKQGLQRVKETEAMFGLNPTQRADNIADAFAINPKFLKTPFKGSILLLDDIYTTGATVKEAAATLKKHHISVTGVVSLSTARK